MRYPIKYLESLSGIKAHTIRIWEQRYGVLVPKRTSTNIRYYDDDQLRHLLNIVSLLDKGKKISEIAAMTHHQVEAEIRQLSSGHDGLDIARSALINEIIISALRFDRVSFEAFFEGAVKKFGFHPTIETILYPALRRVGVLWQAADMNPAQEHFISNLVRQKLYAACDRISPRTGARKYLLFLPEGEHHEIGLLYFNYLLLVAGKPAIYLGMDVPMASLKMAVKANQPHTLVFFVVRSQVPGALKKYLGNLKKLFPGTRVILCAHSSKLSGIKPLAGQSFFTAPEEARQLLNI